MERFGLLRRVRVDIGPVQLHVAPGGPAGETRRARKTHEHPGLRARTAAIPGGTDARPPSRSATVYGLPSEGTSGALPQLASVSSDRRAQDLRCRLTRLDTTHA